MSSIASLLAGANPVAQAAAAGVQLGQHAITEYASIQKHKAENPSPSTGPAKGEYSNTTLGIYNKIQQKTEIFVIKDRNNDGPSQNFVNGAAWGAGALVVLGVGAWIWGKLAPTKQEESVGLVLFGGQEHYDED